MGTLFGTDGIRGEANRYPMTPEMVVRIGQAIAATIPGEKRKQVVIGHDGRLSGAMIESALTAGLCSMGVDVLRAGLLPTPGVAYLARHLGLAAGLVVSASHNPFRDNGIKIFSGDGFKLDDETERRIESAILSPSASGEPADPPDLGRSLPLDEAEGIYIAFLEETLGRETDLSGLRVVLDCSNGATSVIAPALFNRLDVPATVLFASPNGLNINDDCGSQHLESLAREVVKRKADLGLAFDGDGDRMIAVDEKGAVITGDRVLFICGRQLRKEKRLPGDLIVCTVMSNFGLHDALKKAGIRTEITDVGDRYVLDRMRTAGAVLGGEDSGHLIFLDHHTTGDGMISALQLMRVMKKSGSPLSLLAAGMTVFPQCLVNVPVRQKPDLSTIPEISKAIADVEEKLGGGGRILVRYSGTQPLCRVMVEGPTEEVTEECCRRIARVVKKTLS